MAVGHPLGSRGTQRFLCCHQVAGRRVARWQQVDGSERRAMGTVCTVGGINCEPVGARQPILDTLVYRAADAFQSSARGHALHRCLANQSVVRPGVFASVVARDAGWRVDRGALQRGRGARPDRRAELD